MTSPISADFAGPAIERLIEALDKNARQYPGGRAARQPVHTVYGGAHLFKRDIASRIGNLARNAFSKYITSPRSLEEIFETSPAVSEALYRKIAERLRNEPVEDYRIDFEDGYGLRSEAEEDEHARIAGREMAEGLCAGLLPAFVGIRIKSLSRETLSRAMRTLDLFLGELLNCSNGRLPGNFVVTLPKVLVPEQVSLLSEILGRYETRSGVAAGAIRLELMVETPAALVGTDGGSPLLKMIDAADGRCAGIHFGAFDYLACCGIPAAEQNLQHKVCDFARNYLLATLAGRGINLADGVTTILPIEIHKARESLTEAQISENRQAVTRGWRLHYSNVRHSLSAGYFQSWDLHPAQIPARYAAIYDFYIGNLGESAARLVNFIGMATRATTVGGVFDDAASAQGLLDFFSRAVGCGAISESEASHLTGLRIDEIRTGSFVEIIATRSTS